MLLISRRSLACLTIAAGVLATPSLLQSQPASAASVRDSAQSLGAARKAQARFERLRAHRLPWTSGGGGHVCQEHVGRYCVWHDGPDKEWVAPPEHRDIAEARDALLADLRAAAAAHPGDEWIVGQRIAYLIEAGRFDDALDAAAACAAQAWWCEALGGLVRHVRGDVPAAERGFGRALALMQPDVAARWTDPSPLLSRKDQRVLAASSGAARDSLIAGLWWLSDPLWMRAGNDRRTEHLARRTWARIAATARNVEGIGWGRDMETLLLRFGWPSGWERYQTSGLERRTTIVTHRPAFGRDFVPPLDLAGSLRLVDDWPITPPMPGSEYSPPYARFQGSLPAQVVVVPDGDSVTIAAAFAFEHDSIAPDESIDAALVAATPVAAIVDSGSCEARRVIRQVRVARRDDVVISIEAVSKGIVPRAARRRAWAGVAARDSTAIQVSDPVLIDGNGPAPAWRDAALHRMLLPAEIASADSVAVYFEISRLAPDVAVDLELALEPERGGALRRIGESVGLASPRSAVRVAWRERPPANGSLTRTVTLGFGAVPAGRYTLHLAVRQDAAWGTSTAPVDRRKRR